MTQVDMNTTPLSTVNNKVLLPLDKIPSHVVGKIQGMKLVEAR